MFQGAKEALARNLNDLNETGNFDVGRTCRRYTNQWLPNNTFHLTSKMKSHTTDDATAWKG